VNPLFRPERLARWRPALDRALEASLLSFFFLLVFPNTSDLRTVALALALVLWVVKTRALGEPVRGRGLWLNWIIAVYAAFVLIATVLSVDPVISVKALRGDLSKFLLAYLLVVEVLGTPQQLTRLFGALAIASTVVVAWGIGGGWTRTETLNAVTWLPLFHNPNVIAAYLVLPTTALAGLTVLARRFGPKFGWGVAFAAHASLLLSTGSRTAVTATVVALLVFSAVTVRRLRAWAWCAVLVTLATFVIQREAPDVFARYLSLLHAETYVREGADSGMTDRRLIWKDTLTLARAHPWAGYGYGANLYPRVAQAAKVPSVVALGPQPHAHNLWLQTLFETGIFGAGLLNVVWVGGLIVLWRGIACARTSEQRVIGGVLAGGIAAVLVHSLTEAIYGSGMFGIVWWALLGAVISLRLHQLARAEAGASDVPSRLAASN
jgi:O-antigen ligase